jgi:hypothetical protein
LPSETLVTILRARFATLDRFPDELFGDRFIVQRVVGVGSEPDQTFGCRDANQCYFAFVTRGVERSKASSIERIASTSSRVGTKTSMNDARYRGVSSILPEKERWFLRQLT